LARFPIFFGSIIKSFVMLNIIFYLICKELVLQVGGNDGTSVF
jgi:hypothetical protein